MKIAPVPSPDVSSATDAELAIDFTASRGALLADTSLRGRAWAEAYRDLADRWLAQLFAKATAANGTKGIVLIAVGGYGRGELCPGSDLDVLLLHAGRSDVSAVADAIWYPIWDARVHLGHAVRTVKEALSLAADDLDTASALLDARLIAGDPALFESLAKGAEASWLKRSRKWLVALRTSVAERADRAGEVAFLLEPDLKIGRGGLRDAHTLRWAERARHVLHDTDLPALDHAYDELLAVRVELQRLSPQRGGDVLLLQDQDAVADALGLADADALMARVASAGKTISWLLDDLWWRIDGPGGAARRSGGDRSLAPGIVLHEGAVELMPTASVVDDPTLVLRLAAVAATTGTRIGRATLQRLAAEAPRYPEPWPLGARGALVDLLRAGTYAIPVIEALDHVGVWTRVLPEWEPVRSKPQRNAYHRFTVDRHLLETVANAAALATRVERPDLLVLGALLHDLGKGYPGDHTDAGVELVLQLGPRLGFSRPDVDVLVSLVRHHLLLPDVATRRDLDDDATISQVVAEVGSGSTLELLAALTEADSLATGPSAWSAWKAELVDELVHRALHVIGGGSVHEVARSTDFPTPDQLAALRASATHVAGVDDTLTVVARDRHGLFSRVAGVLVLHGLDVLSAGALSSDAGMALEHFRVAASYPLGDVGIDWDRVVADVHQALAGRLAIDARVADRVRTYRPRRRSSAVADPATVEFDNAASSSATVMEVRAPDGVGVLYRITRALSELDLDIRTAKVQTQGANVVDVFYLLDADGKRITEPAHQTEVKRAVLHAVGRD